jgi:hypothetical protein
VQAVHGPADLTWTEAAAALVQNKDVRVTEHRRGQPQPLAHAEGELPDSPPSVHGEPGLGQDAQVIQGGTPGVAAGRLEDRADPTHRVRQLAVPPATERRGPAAWCHETQEHPEGGGLAGAVGPAQGRDLARQRDGAHLVDRENVPERLGEVVQLNSTWQGSGHGDVSELR